MVAYLTLDSSVIVASLREQEEKRRLGFEPAMLFEDGIRELVAWGDAEDRSDVAFEELKEKGLVER